MTLSQFRRMACFNNMPTIVCEHEDLDQVLDAFNDGRNLIDIFDGIVEADFEFGTLGTRKLELIVKPEYANAEVKFFLCKEGYIIVFIEVDEDD